jgi:hypothetical protein
MKRNINLCKLDHRLPEINSSFHSMVDDLVKSFKFNVIEIDESLVLESFKNIKNCLDKIEVIKIVNEEDNICRTEIVGETNFIKS